MQFPMSWVKLSAMFESFSLLRAWRIHVGNWFSIALVIPCPLCEAKTYLYKFASRPFVVPDDPSLGLSTSAVPDRLRLL